METTVKESPKVVEKKKPVVIIKAEFCKGCDICVQFCPTNVLAMDKLVAVVVKPDACTGCMMCELLCPDFAIKVEK